MEIKMTCIYNKNLKKSSYFYMVFTVLILNSGSYGNNIFLNEESYFAKERLSLSSIKDNIAEDLERKPKYAFEGVRITDDEAQKDIKQCPKGKSSLKKQVKKAAKRAAQERAYIILGNKEEAEIITSSILKGKRISGNKDKGYYLAQNSAMNAAKQAAYEAALSITHEEEKAEKIVAKLKLDHYAKKSNKKGGKVITSSSSEKSQVTTLQDLEKEKKVSRIKEAVLSHLDRAKLGADFGSKGIDLAFKLIDLMLKLRIIG